MRHPVEAQIVGVLSDLSVDDGDLVEANQQVCCVESMKTMFPLYAPVAGRVGFSRELGDVVGEGEVVFEIEDSP